MVPIGLVSLYWKGQLFQAYVPLIVSSYLSAELDVPTSADIRVGISSLLSDSRCVGGKDEAFASQVLQSFFEHWNRRK